MTTTRPSLETVVEPMLQRAAMRAEHGYSRLRVGVAILALVGMNLHAASLGMLLAPRFLAFSALILVALAIPTALLLAMRAGVRDRRLLLWSALGDLIVVPLFPLMHVLFPPVGYGAVLYMPEMMFLLLASSAGGLRLDTRLARFSGAAFTAAFVGLLVLDAVVDPSTVAAPIDWVYGIAAQLGAAGIGLVLASRGRSLAMEGAQAAVDAERARQRLGTYVSEEVANLAMSTDELEIGGVRSTAAILFSDLRGFTPYAEEREPEDVVTELNEYLECMVRPIREEGGLIDKYIGDAIMAVFGIPESRGDEAARALRAAERMAEALEGLNAARTQRGLPPLQQGIGVHHGTVLAGNIGTKDRLQYTVIGDAVNLASRLETATKYHDAAVLVSDACMEEARARGATGQRWEALGPIELRGHRSLEAWRLPRT